MAHALHEYADASRFTSWGSIRHCSGFEHRTGTATRNTNVQRNKHCCMLCLAWCVLCCMLHSAWYNSRNASEGTWNARWNSSEPEEASTSAADMWASRAEVGDGLPFGSEHAQYLVENRRLRAEIELRDAEIER
jgi:hypothetical protein